MAARPLALVPTPIQAAAASAPAPVEYAVAVDEYLAQASLSPASRRVYRISLSGWAWPLVGRPVPTGPDRRRAVPPVVPLALFGDAGTCPRLAAALADRAVQTDARTVNRELSALRSAAGWWLDQRWITLDPTAGLQHLHTGPATAPPLTAEQARLLFRLPASLREHAFWRLLHDSGAPAAEVLALDAEQLDLSRNRARSPGAPIGWQEATGQILRWLLAGRASGPVFVTGRRAAAHVPARDVCPVTGQARMSYRRAAEIFAAATRPLDPSGRGWALHQLRGAG